MANQEGAGRGIGRIFGITPIRERTPVPVLPSQSDVVPASPEPGKLPKTKKPLIQRLVGNLAVRIALAGTAVAGIGYATYQEVPAVHQAVDQQFLERIGLKSQEIPSTFDNTKEKQIIGDNNIQRITVEEAEKEGLLTPKIDLEKKTVTIPFPFIIPVGTTATIDKTPQTVRGIENNTPRIVLPENSKPIFPKGTSIIFIKGGAEGGSDPNAIYTIIATYPDPNNVNVFQQWQIEIPGGITSNIRTNNPSLSPLESLALLKKYDFDISKMMKDKAVLTSDGKTPIATITGGPQLVNFYSTTFQGPKTDFSGRIEQGINNQFTVINDKLLALTTQ